MSYLVITGPTASGKSGFALQIAKALNGIIINADSMQIYKDLPILTAQPTPQDKQECPHALYGILEPSEECSAAFWQKKAVEIIVISQQKGLLPIVVGGTGLYLKSLIEGLSHIPLIEEDMRNKVRNLANSLTLEDFKALVLKEDPFLAQNNPPKDRQRLSRALEVKWQTGQSIREFQGKATPPLPPPQLMVACFPERERLYQNINHRFDTMIDNGVLEEIKHFNEKYPHLVCSLQKAIGYNPLSSYLKGEIPLEYAIEEAKMHTRQYAKRQLTWIKNQFPNIDCNISLQDVLTSLD